MTKADATPMPHDLVAELRQLDHFQHLGDALVRIRLGHAGDPQPEANVLRNG